MIIKKGHIDRHVLGFFIATLVFNPNTVPTAAAQDQCAQEMAEAREKYNNGDFSTAIAVLGNCLRKSGLTPTEKKQAYELLALIHVANDDTVQAKRVLQELWKVEPNYNPNLVEEAPALFIRLALATKPNLPTRTTSEQTQPRDIRRSKKWLWISGGTAVIAGVGAIIVLSGGGKNNGSIKVTW
jgi:hypothetical protein